MTLECQVLERISKMKSQTLAFLICNSVYVRGHTSQERLPSGSPTLVVPNTPKLHSVTTLMLNTAWSKQEFQTSQQQM